MMIALNESERRPIDARAEDRPWSELEAQYREECAVMLRDARRHLEQRVEGERAKIETALAAFARDFDAWLERERRGETSQKPSLATLFEIWLERGARRNEPRPLLASFDEAAKRRAAMAEAEAASLRERLEAETARARDLERRLSEARARAQRETPAPEPARNARRAAMPGRLVAAVLVALMAVAGAVALAQRDSAAAGLHALQAEARHMLGEFAARRARAEALAALIATDRAGTIARVIAADPAAVRARLKAIAPEGGAMVDETAPERSVDAPASAALAAPAPALAAPAAPASKPADFQGYDNRDLSGAQIASLRMDDVSGCIAACREKANCAAYVFDKWNRVCRLKSRAAAFRLNPRATSGLRAEVPTPRPPSGAVTMERYPSRAFPGAGYRSTTAEGSRACETACRDDSACVAFTFRLDEALCRLFATTGEYFPDKLADSGGKRQGSAE
jgi:hypothetical protein